MWDFCIEYLFCSVVYNGLSFHLTEIERAGCLTLILSLLSRDCLYYICLPRGVVGWSVNYDSSRGMRFPTMWNVLVA